MTLAVSPILVLLILLYGAASDQVVGVDITTVENPVGTWVILAGPCGNEVWSNTAGASVSYSFTGTGWAANLGFTAPGHILVDDGVSNPVEYDQDVAGTSCSVAAQHQNMAYGQYTVKITISSGEGGLTSFQYWTYDDTQFASVSSTSMAAIASASVASVGAQSAQSVQSVGSVAAQSAASINSIAQQSQAMASIAAVSAQSLASVASVSNAAQASIVAQSQANAASQAEASLAAQSQASVAALQSLSVASIESLASVSGTAYAASVAASITSVQSTASLASAAAAASSSAAIATALAKHRLSTGAIIGIVVGCVAGLIILFFILRRCTERQTPGDAHQVDDGAEYHATIPAAAPSPAAAWSPYVSPRESQAVPTDTMWSPYGVEKPLPDIEDEEAAYGVERPLPEGVAQAIVGTTPTTSTSPTSEKTRPLPSLPSSAISPAPPPYQGSQPARSRRGSI